MNFVTTNIRLPEDVYMDLKIEAAERRKSIAAIIRERIMKKNRAGNADTGKVMEKLEKLASENSKYMKDKNAAKYIKSERRENDHS